MRSEFILAMADDAEVELCVNCGLPPRKVDPTIPITLLFSKATRQVLCLEAGKDFVDTLMGFLTLPMGCIIKLLEEASMIHRPECGIAPPLQASPTIKPKKGKNDSSEHFFMSSISNIFESVVRLDTKEMSADKKCLVDPKPAIPFGAGKLLSLTVTPSTTDRSTVSTEPRNYYGCGNACSFYTSGPATKCPKHKKKMNVPFKIVEPGHGVDANEHSDANSQVCLDMTPYVTFSEFASGTVINKRSCSVQMNFCIACMTIVHILMNFPTSNRLDKLRYAFLVLVTDFAMC